MTENTQADGSLVRIPTNVLAQGAGDGAGLSVPMPFANRITLIDDTYVAGTTHVPNITEIVEGMRPGQELRFVRDAANAYDCWAIRVFAGTKRVGFVSCDQNEFIARLMDGGKHVGGIVTDIELIGHWNKIHMEVFLDD